MRTTPFLAPAVTKIDAPRAPRSAKQTFGRFINLFLGASWRSWRRTNAPRDPLSLLRALRVSAVAFCLLATIARAQPTSQPTGVVKLPHIEVDIPKKELRVECEALRVREPLEFFCVLAGTSEHEAVLRTRAKPSQIHAGLMMLGLQPGEGLRYSEAAKKLFPPHGPPLSISVEFQKDGKRVQYPASRLMRDIKSKQAMPAISWIFAGSRMMEGNSYAADTTGYVVSIVNFELTLIDVPELASSANETLLWESNLDLLPDLGAPVTMIIQPMPGAASTTSPATSPRAESRPQPMNLAAQSPNAGAALSDVHLDQQLIDRARQRWEKDVKPHADAIRGAAQAQYEVILALRREQQRLIDEADRIQRVIDQVEKDYQQMTTPRPANEN